MKKRTFLRIISSMLASMMLICMVPVFNVFADSVNYKLGDANVDEVVNIKDATLIRKVIVGLTDTSVEGLFAADINSDTCINIKDATAILKYCAAVGSENLLIGEYMSASPDCLPSVFNVDVPTVPEEIPFDTGINVDGTVYNAEVGDTVTYTVALTVEKAIEDIQATIVYDSDKLDIDGEIRFPNLSGVFSNEISDGVIKYNISDVSGFAFSQQELVVIDFIVKDTSYSEINQLVEEMTIMGDGSESYFTAGSPSITEGISVSEKLTGEFVSEVSPEVTEPETEPTTSTQTKETGIHVGGTILNANIGDTVTYKVDLTAARLFENIQATVTYDSEKLELVRKSDVSALEREIAIPNMGAVLNMNLDGEVKFNASYTEGYNFTEEKLLITLDFVVKDTSYSEISLLVEEMTIMGDGSESYFTGGNPSITEGITLTESIELFVDTTVKGYTSDGLKYEIVDDEIAIIDYTGEATTITIPDVIDGYSVKKIGAGAFSYSANLETVTIPESVTVVERYAFYECSGLKSIVIPEGVEIIETSMFEGCTALSSIIIPESVTSIDDYAFYYCTSLLNITIPDNVTSIGYGAFCNCSGLESVTISKSTTNISYNAFFNCISLSSITVDENNTVYDSRNNCNAIIETATSTLILGCKKTIIPEGVTSIGERAFYECELLESITIPESVTNIGACAFAYCLSLASITIPENITSIDVKVFMCCESLGNITIPKSVTSIGDGAFYGCANLLDVYFGGSQTQWNEITVDYGNESLTNATIHFAIESDTGSETQPTTEVGDASEIEYVYDDFFESEHNYADNTDKTWIIDKNGNICLSFSENTYVEDGFDFIYIYDENNCLIGEYTGSNLAGETIYINGGFAKIQLVTDLSVNGYGFQCNIGNWEIIEETTPDEVVDYITVYFTDVLHWGGVFTIATDLGEVAEHQTMEYVDMNAYGEDVYSAKIPSNAVRIWIYSDDGMFTVDIFDFKDGVGYYCTEEVDVCVYDVASYVYDSPEEYPTSDETATSSDEEESSSADYVEYIIIYFTNVRNWEEIYLWYEYDNDMSVYQREMEWVDTNAYGQNIYWQSIPADADAIYFTSNGTEYTELIYTFEDGVGYYCTSQSEVDSNIYAVGSYVYGSADETTTATEFVSENVTEPETESTTVTEVVTESSTAESEDKTVTIYFTKGNNWENAYIYGFYGVEGGDLIAEWPCTYPGAPMTLVEVNEYGQSVYKAEVPADIDYIKFSDGSSSNRRTNNAPNSMLGDNIGFALDASVGTNKWSLTTYIYEPSVQETDPTEPTESTATDPIEPDTGSSEPATEPEEETGFTVVFLDYNGMFLDVQVVKSGESALAPESPERKGYNFVGWDTEFSNVTSNLTVKAVYEKIPTTPVPAPTTGALKVEVVGGTGFTIAIDGGSARPQGPSYMNSKMPIGASVTVKANSASGAEFIGWQNSVTGAVLSKDQEYTFLASGNDSIKAMFAVKIDGVQMVTFKNSKAGNFGRVLDSQYYASTDAISFPDAPTQVGYDFAGWSMTEAEIQSAIANGEDVTVVAIWTKSLVPVEITVVGGEGSGTYYANNAVTVTANEPDEGKKFAYWTDASGNIRSYNAEYTFFPSEDTTVTAVFVDEDTEIDYQILVSLDSIDTTTVADKNVFTYSWYCPDNYTFVKAGIVAVNKDNYNEATFVAGSSDANVYDRSPSGANLKPVNTFTWTKSNVTSGQTWRAMAYVQYRDADGNIVTVYSDVVEATKD